MRLFLEAMIVTKIGTLPFTETLLALDVTELSEEDRILDLADTKTLFPDAKVRWHECCHDENRLCTMREA